MAQSGSRIGGAVAYPLRGGAFIEGRNAEAGAVSAPVEQGAAGVDSLRLQAWRLVEVVAVLKAAKVAPLRLPVEAVCKSPRAAVEHAACFLT